jgi:hypothetical protein
MISESRFGRYLAWATGEMSFEFTVDEKPSHVGMYCAWRWQEYQ